MAKVNINGKIVELSDDPAKQKKEIEDIQKKNDYQKQIDSAKTEEEAFRIYLSSIPVGERPKKRSNEQIERIYKSCATSVTGAVATYPIELKRWMPKEGASDLEFCETYRRHQYIKNKILDELEGVETSKSGKPDPIPNDTPIAPVQPKTKTTVSVLDGTTKSTTVTIAETIKPEKSVEPISTPYGDVPVASTQPAVYGTQASKNKASEKVHILKTQKHTRENQAEILTKVSENLIPIEADIKAGGTQLITYEKDKHETIGSVVNTFPCIRKDDSGEFRPKSVNIEGKGAFVNHSPVSYTEEVENSRFPCGTYSVNVSNKYDLSVGAGGADISTLGNMKMGSGGRTLISAAEEMNISSGNGNTNIRAKHNISLNADSVTLESPNQVVVNANLGVAKNAIINGCAFVDGELYVNHITCPAEVQYTGGGLGSFGQLMVNAGPTGNIKGKGGGGAIIGYADVSYIKKLLTTVLKDSRGDGHKYSWDMPDKVPVMVLPDSSIGLASSVGNTKASNPEYSVFMYPHLHAFNNIPLSFTTGNEEMRARASILNSGNIGVASPIQHGYKTPVA
jgi:hypothetical protein